MTMEYRWIEPQDIDEDALAKLREYPPVIRRLLYTRGIRSAEEAQGYFNPSAVLIADPLSLRDVKSAAKVIEKAIAAKEKIFIHGDFDADGLSATAILWEYLYRERGADALPYIPSRVDEGYGMSEKSLEAIREKGGSLVISVDCGVRDGRLIRKFIRNQGKRSSWKTRKRGLNFVITDHHQLGGALPRGVPMVHPLHPKGVYENQYLSGAGVAWKLITAMEKLRNPRNLRLECIPGLDLAGFATVCDLMPLSGENRVIVSLALEKIRNTPRLGLRELMREAQVSPQSVSSYDIGYILGPRINAAGRIGDPLDALRLFTTENENVARSLAHKLGALNRDRQKRTDDLLAEVREQIEREGKGEHLYFAFGNDWNEGIIGLVAGKLQELYHRPVVLVTEGKEGARGSARSINGFNIVEAIGKYEDLLVKHGGHALAAGFTIQSENVAKFGKLLQDHARKFLTPEMLSKELRADGKVDAGELDWELMKLLEKMEPYGYGNRKPVFWISGAVVVESRKIGDGSHLKLLVKGNSGDALECVFFGGGERAREAEVGSTLELMGNLEVNVWNGSESLQFRVIDMREQ